MNASEFKAKCLAILDEVAKTREPVTILKRGKPIALLVPAHEGKTRDQWDLVGSVTIVGDILSPVVEPWEWEAEGGGSA